MKRKKSNLATTTKHWHWSGPKDKRISSIIFLLTLPTYLLLLVGSPSQIVIDIDR